MLEALTPRGPDEQGVYKTTGARLGVRRLRVIDLETGSQPITTEDGALTIVFNGEIYNYRDLRRDLEARGHRFRTHSDTETVLLGFREWSCDVFDRLDGMFGVAIWIPVNEEPHSRAGSHRGKAHVLDPRGRPLGVRVGNAGDPARADETSLATDRVALARYLVLRILSQPGQSCARSSQAQTSRSPDVLERGRTVDPFLVASDTSRTCRAERERSKSSEHDILPGAVRSRLVSDVPLGAFLSGGIDSTIIVDEMAAAVRRRGPSG